MSDVEGELAQYIAAALARPLPAEVGERAKLHILDTLAAIVSGSRLPPGIRALAYVEAEGGRPEALVIGSRHLTSPVNAALANGMSGHADETDDSSAPALLHPGCIVLPAALAAGERWRRSGQDLVRATALGYDVAVRFSLALGAYKLHTAGRCVPGFAGVFGAAAAGAAMAGLDPAAIRHVLSYAGQQASGLSSWRRDPDHIEKAFAFGGMPARNGMAAVTMVASGMTGVADVLTGKPSFLGAFSVVDGAPRMLLEGLGRDLEIARTNIKKWCVGSPVQAALDAVEALMQTSGLTAARVARMRIHLPTLALSIVDRTTMPDLDVRLLVAALLVEGRLTFAMVHDHARLETPPIRALARRIDVIGSDELERLRPERQAIVEVDTAEGDTLVHRTRTVRGTTANPMTRAEVEAKALDLMAPVLSEARSRRLVEAVRGLERLSEATDLRELLMPAQ